MATNTTTRRGDFVLPDGTVIPGKRVVCPECDGLGRALVDGLRGHAFTAQELDEAGPDFFDDMMTGVYDRRCPECDGANVVTVPDEERWTPDQRHAYEEWMRVEMEDAEVWRMENRHLLD